MHDGAGVLFLKAFDLESVTDSETHSRPPAVWTHCKSACIRAWLGTAAVFPDVGPQVESRDSLLSPSSFPKKGKSCLSVILWEHLLRSQLHWAHHGKQTTGHRFDLHRPSFLPPFCRCPRSPLSPPPRWGRSVIRIEDRWSGTVGSHTSAALLH